MFTPDNEPIPDALNRLLSDEERDALARPGVPEDVRADILERLESRRLAELEEERAEDKSDTDAPIP